MLNTLTLQILIGRFIWKNEWFHKSVGGHLIIQPDSAVFSVEEEQCQISEVFLT